jgi:hypothetical protein
MHKVTDPRGSANDQIEHAAKTIGRSPQRRAVFVAIYRGKRKAKTVTELNAATRLGKMRVLQLGRELASQHIVEQTTIDGEVAYVKDDFYGANKAKILRYAADPKKLEKLPTKTRPLGKVNGAIVRVEVASRLAQHREIHLDDIESFKRVRKIKPNGQIGYTAMLEGEFKKGVKAVLSEQSSFKDWGGEKNDLISTRVLYKGKRVPTAFAFKGRGRKGKLTPSQMGKNGDQIGRLFDSEAELFIVQFWGEIDESIRQHVATFSLAQSVKNSARVLYCIIDGVDSTRLIRAYPESFNLKE